MRMSLGVSRPRIVAALQVGLVGRLLAKRSVGVVDLGALNAALVRRLMLGDVRLRPSLTLHLERLFGIRLKLALGAAFAGGGVAAAQPAFDPIQHIQPPLAVAAILVVVVHPLVGLSLALLLRGAAGAVAAAVLAALAVVALVGAATVPHGFHALVSFLRSRR